MRAFTPSLTGTATSAPAMPTSDPLCLDAVDANDDGTLNIADVLTVLMHLFLDPVPLPPPFGAGGTDLTPDPLDCRSYKPCP